LQRVLAKRSVRSDTADRIAVALGRHPWELWPEWFSWPTGISSWGSLQGVEPR
jgi:lambda repressor-like predicted transcriptional regulator